MSALKEALEFIEHWVKTNMPDHPAMMRQGLSREEIDEKIKDLPFELPEEIYDFYQWHDGGLDPFLPNPEAWDLTRLPSLEESVSNAKNFGLPYPIFPILNTESGLYFILGATERCETSPVYSGDMPDEAIEQNPDYPSLTSMMQELANELRGRN